MPYDLSASENLSPQIQHVGDERQPVIIVDDFLRFPDAMVDYAATECTFGPPTTVFPGVVAPTPAAYLQTLHRSLGRLVASTFNLKLETGRVGMNFFGIVTTLPDRLNPFQRMPHVDCVDPGQVAFLQYFCDPTQGGTAFYRHRATGYQSLNAGKFSLMQKQIKEDVREHGPGPASYPSEDRLYEQIAAVDAKFNRLIIYRSAILHSGIILPATRLDPNPRVGRLTANTFVAFERA